MATLKHSYAPDNVKCAERNISHCVQLGVLLVLSITLMLVSDVAFAYSSGGHTSCIVTTESVYGIVNVPNGGVENPFCNAFLNISGHMTGVTGKVVATVAIAVAGLMALFGKLTWPQALVIAAGVGVIFGAASLLVPQGSVIANVDTAGLTADPLSLVLKTMVLMLTSEGGRALGIFCAVILGVGALYGKITWPQTLMWVVGMGMIFGGADLVSYIWYNNSSGSNVTNSVSGLLLGTQMNGSIYMHGVDRAFFGLLQTLVGPGGLGTTLGTLGVMVLGVLALLGKLSGARAILLTAGIAMLWGAMDIVYILESPLNTCNQNISDPFTHVMCAFMEELQGPIAKIFATFGVMMIGIGAMLGKISWEAALVVAVGIALIFGAFGVVNMLEEGARADAGGGAAGNYFNFTTCSTAAPLYRDTGNALNDVLCYMVHILFGPAGKALAMIAVIMMGFGALMGKISYTQAAIVAVGIAVTFAAPNIVSVLLPSANLTGCPLIDPRGAAHGASAELGAC